MAQNYDSLLQMEFIPLSEAKAKLSEQLRKLSATGKRIAITNNGKPAAVLLGYEDYLKLLKQMPGQESEWKPRVIDIKDWKKQEPMRQKVRDSILGLFDPSALSRKGQKTYKREKVREFSKKT